MSALRCRESESQYRQLVLVRKRARRPLSSNDRNSTLVGNLTSVEYNVTRNNSHECDKSSAFCFIYGEFEVSKYRRPLSDKLKSLYRDCFSFEITNQDVNWVPHIVCGAC